MCLFPLRLFTQWNCPVPLNRLDFSNSYFFTFYCSLSSISLSLAFNNPFIQHSSLISSLALSFSPLQLNHCNMRKPSVSSQQMAFILISFCMARQMVKRTVMSWSLKLDINSLIFTLQKSLGLQKWHLVIYFDINQLAFTLQLNCAGLIFQRKLLVQDCSCLLE